MFRSNRVPTGSCDSDCKSAVVSRKCAVGRHRMCRLSDHRLTPLQTGTLSLAGSRYCLRKLRKLGLHVESVLADAQNSGGSQLFFPISSQEQSMLKNNIIGISQTQVKNTKFVSTSSWRFCLKMVKTHSHIFVKRPTAQHCSESIAVHSQQGVKDITKEKSYSVPFEHDFRKLAGYLQIQTLHSKANDTDL